MEEIRMKVNTPYKLILEYKGVDVAMKVISINDVTLSLKRTKNGKESGDLKIDQMDVVKWDRLNETPKLGEYSK